MPRLFTGLEVPPEVASALASLRGGLVGARWIDVENYHVTLRFMGDIDDHYARDVYHMLADVRRRPITLTIDGLTTFGGDKPRALVARIKPEQALIEFQAEQERIVRRAGLPPEKRKFTPHVTLARLRDTTPWHVADFLAGQGHVPSRSFTANRFVLFSSRASTGGGPYVVEAAYPLG
ncbi:RNA 2',3'-cyclic phosphodiesterase [Alsobacter metallidurans]|uniref:RNA 2',3'-cyclic phosphodiesterase n=1 Tax=Alsobacter metallidurans TaxID=340221 RepID=A0A917IAY3_9HYPH|nr:RNA 2',3'-cyclic phosphodiesterase [Alsobacter metallidurans]GGH30102.1 RNA 2',3'-cyclic phosphodiesterase [Alsobacter metallidurans]